MHRDPSTLGVLSARLGEHDWMIELPPFSSLRGDLLGRWQTARFEGRLYRRLLDGGVVFHESPRAAPVEVAPGPAYARVSALARELQSALARATASHTVRVATKRTAARAGELLHAELERCAQRAARGPDPDRRAYRAAYAEAVEILPPDRYRDLVLLPAVGCPSANCSFCAFYRGRPFRPLNRAEFRAHLEALLALLGPALPLRTGLFLGSASALSLSQQRLVEALVVASETFSTRPRGVAAFWDPDHSPRRSEADWRELLSLSLRAVYVGLETGLPSLRESVGKSGELNRLIRLVSDARRATPAGAFRIGVIVMAGLGGAALVDEHLQATVDVVGRLELAEGDLVYVSPLAGSLEASALERERGRLKRALGAVTPARVVPYAMERFRYFS